MTQIKKKLKQYGVLFYFISSGDISELSCVSHIPLETAALYSSSKFLSTFDTPEGVDFISFCHCIPNSF